MSSSLKYSKQDTDFNLELQNEDSNSSSINLPAPSSSKRTKSSSNKQITFSLANNEADNNAESQLIDTFIEEENEQEEVDEKGEQKQQQQQQGQCPIKDCDSKSNLDGVSERHFTYETCPKYFDMRQEECKERRSNLNKLFVEYNERAKTNSENKKQLRNRVSNKKKKNEIKNRRRNLFLIFLNCGHI